MEHIFTTQSRGQKLKNVLRSKERRDRSQDTEADKSSWEVGKMEDDSCGPCVPSTATICQTTAAARRKCSALWQTWGGKWTSWLQTQYFHPRIFIIFFFSRNVRPDCRYWYNAHYCPGHLNTNISLDIGRRKERVEAEQRRSWLSWFYAFQVYWVLQ